MPASSACSAVDSLWGAYGRVWRAAAVGAGAAAGTFPLLYALAGPVWLAALLGLLALAYLAGRVYRLRRTRQALRQLRLERSFVEHSFETGQLRDCLTQQRHLWTQCRTVRTLRHLMDHPPPDLPVASRRQHVREAYEQVLADLRPPRLSAGLVAGLLLSGGLVAAAVAYSAPTLWALRLGPASALVLLGAEGACLFFSRRARRAFERLPDALADWTLALRPRTLLKGRPAGGGYRHVRLYRAPAWFAAATRESGSAEASSKEASSNEASSNEASSNEASSEEEAPDAPAERRRAA